ncbi:MAG TPA: DUF2267 domain-containing protein [Anaeromyxobacter sp.]|nr:DUF2267 domain-containing protein [Anaeromyxobacter sp.]
MSNPYQPAGGVGGRLPGTLGPADLDGRAEWVPLRRPRDLLEALAMRLGSEVDLARVVLAVLAPLRASLEGEPLGALTATLPQDLARELADADLNLNARVRAPAGAADYVAEVSRLVLHPPRRAAEYVRAVFAAAKAVIAADALEPIARRLPPDLAAAWRAAR